MHKESEIFVKHAIDTMFDGNEEFFTKIANNKILKNDFAHIMGFLAGSMLLTIGKNFSIRVDESEEKQEESFKDLLEFAASHAYSTYLLLKQQTKH